MHWLVQDRVDYVEVTPSISLLGHARIVAFMALLLVRGRGDREAGRRVDTHALTQTHARTRTDIYIHTRAHCRCASFSLCSLTHVRVGVSVVDTGAH